MLYQLLLFGKVNCLYIYIYPLFFRFFSHTGHYRVLSRIPCVIQQVLAVYLFYIQCCVCVNPHLLIYCSLCYPLGNHKCVFFFFPLFLFLFFNYENMITHLQETWKIQNKVTFFFVQLLNHVRLFATPRTAARPASLSITTPGVHSNSCPSSR